MTLSYSASIPTGNHFFRFFNLLVRWNGSVYKLVWKDLLLYMVLYYSLSFMYRFGLRDNPQANFEDLVVYISTMKAKTLPITFLLGFFVSQILSRWWVMFDSIPTMDSAAFYLSALVMTKADPQVARRIRLTAIRYLNVAWILALKNMSSLTKRRFSLSKQRLHQLRDQPELRIKEELELINHDSVVKKHFPLMITKSEMQAIVELAKVSECPNEYQPDWYIPLQWCSRLLKKATVLGYLANERNYLAIVSMQNSFEQRLQKLSRYSEFNLPLVYSQVVIVSVYSYIFMHLFDYQFLDSKRVAERKLGSQFLFDYYVPILGILELVFVMGWLKVALVLLNPLGSDDEDFPTNDFLDDNLRVSRLWAGNYSIAYPPRLREERCEETKTDLNMLKSFEGVVDSDCDEEEPENPRILTAAAKTEQQVDLTEIEIDNGGFLSDDAIKTRAFSVEMSKL